MTSSLKLNFSHTFSGQIWNMMTSEDGQMLVIEIRDELARRAYFLAVSTSTGEIFWQHDFGNWWMALGAMTPDFIVFQDLQDQSNPGNNRILVVHSHDCKTVWSLDNFTFQGLHGNLICGITGESQVYFNLKTGSPTMPEKVIMESTKAQDPVTRPHQYLSESVHFESVRTFLEPWLKQEISGGVEYLEHNNSVIISYYIDREGIMDNYLAIFDEAGELQMKEKLAEGKGLGLDTFFLLSGCLIFVRNRCELLSYQWYD